MSVKQISEVGRKMLAFQNELAAEFGYQPIELNLFLGDVRETFRDALPEWCVLDGDPETKLYSLSGTLLCCGYNRIVIGDYGAFIEIAPSQIVLDNIKYKGGQEYRYADERYAGHVKYQWLTAKDWSNCKIYYQMLPVGYADYKPGMYYISPYEVDVTPM